MYIELDLNSKMIYTSENKENYIVFDTKSEKFVPISVSEMKFAPDTSVEMKILPVENGYIVSKNNEIHVFSDYYLMEPFISSNCQKLKRIERKLYDYELCDETLIEVTKLLNEYYNPD